MRSLRANKQQVAAQARVSLGLRWREEEEEGGLACSGRARLAQPQNGGGVGFVFSGLLFSNNAKWQPSLCLTGSHLLRIQKLCAHSFATVYK